MPKKETAQPEGLGLSQLVKLLREEIEEAQQQFGQGREPMFAIQDVEAEVHFVIERTTAGKGGLNIHFVALEASMDRRVETTHTLKLHLAPTGGNPIAYAGERD